MTTLHFVVPDAYYDPLRPSGGNTYDRRVCSGLGAIGWDVRVHAVPGSWPWPDGAALDALGATLASFRHGSSAVIDGLIASTAPGVLVAEAARLRLIILVHMPLGDGPSGHEIADARAREQAALSAASAVITTSSWARDRLLKDYLLPSHVVHVAEPGSDAAPAAGGTPHGGALLCVGTVTRHKGYDVLVSALADIAELQWTCTVVGSPLREPDLVARLRARIADAGLPARVRFSGVRVGDQLEAAYAAADLLVHPSRVESYGMVVTEALARGLPVIAADVGGLPEALGHGRDGRRPGWLVRPGDSAALAAALREWLVDAQLRRGLRQAALQRRSTLPSWADTAGRIADVLARVGARS